MWIHACKWTLFCDWIQNSWGNCWLTSWACTIGIWSMLTQLNLIRQIYALCYKSYWKLVHMEIYYELLNFPHREKFPGEKVPTLEEVVELCSSLGLKMIIEIKKGTETLEVRKIIREANVYFSLFLWGNYFFRHLFFYSTSKMFMKANYMWSDWSCSIIMVFHGVTKTSTFFNSLHPNISMHILLTVLHTLLFFIDFLRCWQGEFVLQSRASFCWWWFPILSWP